MIKLSLKARRRLKLFAYLAYFILLIPMMQVGCVGVVRPFGSPAILSYQVAECFKPSEEQERVWSWVPIKEVSPEFLNCVIIAEDTRYFRHWGFDWEAIRAAWAEHRAKGTPSRGASTITQQCARSLFLWQGRSWLRKGLEAYYTIWMELLLSKERILELYVNVIELGEGTYGIEAGAQRHFKVRAKGLNSEQAAMLAAILPNPKGWDPNNPTERVKRRHAAILKRSTTVRMDLYLQ